MSVWPWSDLVSFVMRHARPAGPGFRVLELGCGAGANIPFFLSLGADYHGIEGSPTIVRRLNERFPELRGSIHAGDFTVEIPIAGEFDLVVDRAALTHNAGQAISHCLEQLKARLKPGGKFIGIDWFSTAYSEYQGGTPAEDRFTRTGYKQGPFADVGRVHFSDRAHLGDLFAGYQIMVLEHKCIEREIPADGWSFAAWNIVARRSY